jgi:hypothetical protein
MNEHSLLTKALIVLLFAEITHKHEDQTSHTHEDIRYTVLPPDLMNVSGVTGLT